MVLLLDTCHESNVINVLLDMQIHGCGIMKNWNCLLTVYGQITHLLTKVNAIFCKNTNLVWL